MEDGIYDDFMNAGGEITPPDTKKKKEVEPPEEPIQEVTPPEDKKLAMWEFIHHENGNVTMGSEMFQKLMERILL